MLRFWLESTGLLLGPFDLSWQLWLDIAHKSSHRCQDLVDLILLCVLSQSVLDWRFRGEVFGLGLGRLLSHLWVCKYLRDANLGFVGFERNVGLITLIVMDRILIR